MGLRQATPTDVVAAVRCDAFHSPIRPRYPTRIADLLRPAMASASAGILAITERSHFLMTVATPSASTRKKWLPSGGNTSPLIREGSRSSRPRGAQFRHILRWPRDSHWSAGFPFRTPVANQTPPIPSELNRSGPLTGTAQYSHTTTSHPVTSGLRFLGGSAGARLRQCPPRREPVSTVGCARDTDLPASNAPAAAPFRPAGT